MNLNVGIVGGAGYTAGELLRILTFHTKVNKLYVQSSSNSGKPVTAIHKDLLGDSELVFQEIDYADIQVVFLCSGHGKSREYLDKVSIPPQVKIIDLSHDFRLKNPENEFLYGLPELNREDIKQANKIANPGCFATCIELGILPLAAAKELKENVEITAITGSTGAGYAPTQTSHFSWKNNNVSPYKIFEHQHLDEIRESLVQQQPSFSQELNFVPIRGNFSRGILASIYTQTDLSEPELRSLYQNYYASHPFVFFSEEILDVKQVVNTNKCFLYVKKIKNKAYIISIIDNLLKGASGQAVQNMNLLFGFDEKTGLNLKPIGF